MDSFDECSITDIKYLDHVSYGIAYLSGIYPCTHTGCPSNLERTHMSERLVNTGYTIQTLGNKNRGQAVNVNDSCSQGKG